MRERWRHELDRSSATRFDIKQGRGGLVDIEFLLQALVLEHAARVPVLAAPTRTLGLIDALRAHGALAADDADALARAHDALAAASLDRTLDAAPRVVADASAAPLKQHVAAVLRVAAGHGLDFEKPE
jgi:glutamate-ammonia-ligase adenylyltransferase